MSLQAKRCNILNLKRNINRLLRYINSVSNDEN